MAELGLLSLTQLQKLPLSQQNTHQSNPRPVWMWNPKQAQQDQEDDSWEVRAFAEDTGNVMGTTWPPRSYTCTFCRREFRSAQALGGHMNVHRRDRARLHQVQHPSSISINPSEVSSDSNSSYIFPTQEFLAANGGLCLLYQLPSPNNGAFGNIGTTPTLTATFNNTSSLSSPRVNVDQSSSSSPVAPSTLLSISPNIPPPHDYLMTSPPSCNFVGISNSGNSRTCRSKRSADHQDHQASRRAQPGIDENGSNIEEIDLELRLGPS